MSKKKLLRTPPRYGCSLRVAEAYAEAMGCQYDPPVGTGEGRWFHPVLKSSGKYNLREQDASDHFVCWLRKVYDQLPTPTPMAVSVDRVGW